MHCPLCASQKHRLHHQDKFAKLNRDYYLCRHCDLVFVPPEQHLSVADERRHYENHENGKLDSGYRQFLNRLFMPLSEYRPPPATFLDFGSGSGAGLAKLAAEAGYTSIAYDPLFHPHNDVLQQRYGVIAASEVLEHVVEVQGVIEKLIAMLEKDGVLGIMTGERPVDFANWYYKNDPTHIAFFSAKCFEWLAEKYCLSIARPQTNVWLLQ